MNNYKELDVWKGSIKLAVKMYELTAILALEEKFGLVSQLRRCAVSIPSNIAEGSGRKSNKEFSQFLRIAYGSLCELDTQLIISMELGFLKNQDLAEIEKEVGELQKMLFALISKFSN